MTTHPAVSHMKAIDFACRLLARLAQDDMPHTARRVLLAVAAGLPEARDIARFTGLAPATCSKLLCSLRKSGFVYCNDPMHMGYALTPCGRAKVADLFDFLPGSHA